MQALDLCRQLFFTSDGPLMEGPPITGLLTQFDELKSQVAYDREGEKMEPEKPAEALPEPSQQIRLGIVVPIRVDHEGRRNRNKRSLFRSSRERNQKIRAAAVHPPPGRQDGS